MFNLGSTFLCILGAVIWHHIYTYFSALSWIRLTYYWVCVYFFLICFMAFKFVWFSCPLGIGRIIDTKIFCVIFLQILYHYHILYNIFLWSSKQFKNWKITKLSNINDYLYCSLIRWTFILCVQQLYKVMEEEI